MKPGLLVRQRGNDAANRLLDGDGQVFHRAWRVFIARAQVLQMGADPVERISNIAQMRCL